MLRVAWRFVCMQAREKGIDTPSSRQQKQQQSEGLGRVGPLRFRNNTKKAREASSNAAAPAAEEGKEREDSSSAAAGKH
jgi:hypothetical protein